MTPVLTGTTRPTTAGPGPTMRLVLKRLIATGLAATALAVAGCGDDSDGGGNAGATTVQAEQGSATAEKEAPTGPAGSAPDPQPIPATKITNLERAVAAAGCVLKEFPDEGADHVEDELTAADYKTNPPTSGNHNPVWAPDGYYPEDATPPLKNSVHALEHGRIQIQYRDDIPELRKAQLRALFNEDIAGAGDSYHMLMFANNSDMKPAVAAVAWRNSLTCAKLRGTTFDAIRAFYKEYVDKGPEQVP